MYVFLALVVAKNHYYHFMDAPRTSSLANFNGPRTNCIMFQKVLGDFDLYDKLLKCAYLIIFFVF